MNRPVLEPGPDHPITVTPTEGTVVVTLGGTEIARTDRALSLAEASYPVVQYVPLADVDRSLLRESETTTYCPYKGDAGYYSVALPDGRVEDDVVWFYAAPRPAVKEIADHVAFYGNRADIAVTT